MSERTIIATLKVQPLSGWDPITQSFTLEQATGGGYSLVERQMQRGKPISWSRIPIPEESAESHLSALRQLTIPAYPKETHLLDGSTFVLTIHGGSCFVTLKWDAVAPDGAEGVEAFATWLASHSRQ